MVSIESVKIEGGRVCVALDSGTVLKVTTDAATQVAAQLQAEPAPDAIEVGAIVSISLDDEQRSSLLARIGKLQAHLDGFSD